MKARLGLVLLIVAWLAAAYALESWSTGPDIPCDQPVHCEDVSGPGPGNGR